MSSAVARYFRMHGEKMTKVKLIVRLRLDHDSGNVWLFCLIQGSHTSRKNGKKLGILFHVLPAGKCP